MNIVKGSAILIATIIAALASSARADTIGDLNFLNDYNSTGCGGTWTGMTCRSSNRNRPQSLYDKKLAERRAARKARQEKNTDLILRGVDDLILYYDELEGQFGELPNSPEFSTLLSDNIVCLRASISSLLLHQLSPNVVAIIGRERNGADTVLSSADDFIYQIVLDHVVGMYGHAITLLRKQGQITSTSLREMSVSEKVHDLILSQIKPALTQVEFLTTEVPLRGETPDQKVLFAAIRVGVINEEIQNLDYPFTGPPCYSRTDPSSLSPRDYSFIERTVGELLSTRVFKIDKVMPKELFERTLEPKLSPFQAKLIQYQYGVTEIYRLGISVLDFKDVDLTVPYMVPEHNGVLILSIAPNSPAEQVGWQIGDLISIVKTSNGSFRIENSQQLINALETAGTWETVNIQGWNIHQQIYPFVELRKKR